MLNDFDRDSQLVEAIHRINIKLAFIKDKTSAEYHALTHRRKQLRKELNVIRKKYA